MQGGFNESLYTLTKSQENDENYLKNYKLSKIRVNYSGKFLRLILIIAIQQIKVKYYTKVSTSEAKKLGKCSSSSADRELFCAF